MPSKARPFSSVGQLAQDADLALGHDAQAIARQLGEHLLAPQIGQAHALDLPILPGGPHHAASWSCRAK